MSRLFSSNSNYVIIKFSPKTQSSNNHNKIRQADNSLVSSELKAKQTRNPNCNTTFYNTVVFLTSLTLLEMSIVA